MEIVRFHLLDVQNNDIIKKGLEEKIDSMVKHDLYTKYKTAATEIEREKARQEYLDKVGMRDSFRW